MSGPRLTRALCAEACIDGGVPGWWLDPGDGGRWFLDTPVARDGEDDWCVTVDRVDMGHGPGDAGWKWEVAVNLCSQDSETLAEGHARLAIEAMGQARVAYRRLRAGRR